MADFITVTRTLVKRGWTDFEPKLITGLLTGSVAGFLTSVLSQYGIELSTDQQKALVVGCFFLGGYIAPSTGTTVTKNFDTPTGSHVEQESHSGNAITTATSPTAIQRPTETAPAAAAFATPATPFKWNAHNTGDVDAATQVLNPGDR